MTFCSTLRSTAIAVLASLLLVGCDRVFGPTEADLSAFGEYVYRIDSVQLRDQFAQVLAADTVHDETLTTLRQCYADAKENDCLSFWATRMGVDDDADALLAWLQREVPAAGLDPSAFRLEEIAQD